MLIRLTRSNYSAQFALSILLMFVFWGRNFLVDIPTEFVESQTFLYSILFDWTKTHILLAKILAFFCVLLQALMLSDIERTHSLSKNPMFIGVIYIVLMSTQSNWQTMHPFLISNFFIVGSFLYLFKTYDRKESYEYVFNAGLLLALASLISPSLLPFALVVYCVFLFYPINRWREWLIAALGFGFPFFVLFLWASLTENMNVFSEFSIQITDFENFGGFFEHIAQPVQIFVLATVLFSLIGVGFLKSKGKYNEISQRKKITAIMLGLFWSIIVVIFLFECILSVYLATTFLFSSYFIAEWFSENKRKWLSELMLYVFIIVAFVVQYL